MRTFGVIVLSYVFVSVMAFAGRRKRLRRLEKEDQKVLRELFPK